MFSAWLEGSLDYVAASAVRTRDLKASEIYCVAQGVHDHCLFAVRRGRKAVLQPDCGVVRTRSYRHYVNGGGAASDVWPLKAGGLRGVIKAGADPGARRLP